MTSQGPKQALVKPGRKRTRLWIPLFLLWPFLIAGALLVSIVAPVLALLRLRWRRLGGALLLGPRLLVLFCRFRRLKVEVHDEGEEFLLAVI